MYCAPFCNQSHQPERGLTRTRLQIIYLIQLFFFQYISIMSCFMILLSVTVYCLNTMPGLGQYKAWNTTRYWIDMLCMCWFTLEFMIRLLVCPDRKAFVQSAMNWIDFLSVIPSYLILFPINNDWLINMVIIRPLRLFRFFKLSYGLQVLLHTLKASSYELVLLLLILLIPVVLFSSLVHAVEKNLRDDKVKEPNKFISIPHTFWWCLITMTSVGYGDMVPETWAGKMVGGICAICGVLIVALPISVIGSNFSLYYAHVRARLKLPCKDRKILAGNLRGLLKQPLSLSSRERDRRVLKRNNLVTIRRKEPNKRVSDRVVRTAMKAGIYPEDSDSKVLIAKDLNSSEVCLDWDSTMDSEIQFDVNKVKPQRKSNTANNRRHAVVSIFDKAESDSEASSDNRSDKVVPILRGRRGAQATLQMELPQSGDDFQEKATSAEDLLNGETEMDTDCDDHLINNATPSRDSSVMGHFTSACSSQQGSFRQDSSAVNTPTSRRSSMKLMEFALMPSQQLPSPSHQVKDKEIQSGSAQYEKRTPKSKRKKNKKKKKKAGSPDKTIQNYNGARRGGILPMLDSNADLLNGYSSESSYEDSTGAAVMKPSIVKYTSSQSSIASNLADQSACIYHISEIRIPNDKASDLSMDLLPRLQQLKADAQSRDSVSTTKIKPAISNGSGLRHKPLCQYASLDYDSPKVLLQQKLLRKCSKSDFDLSSRCGRLFLGQNFWHDSDLLMREASSDIELGYVESGV